MYICIYIFIVQQQEELKTWHRYCHLFGLMSDCCFFFRFVCFYFLPQHQNIDQMEASTQMYKRTRMDRESNRLSTNIQLLVSFSYFHFFFQSLTYWRDTFSLNLRRQLIDSSFHSFWSMHKSIKYMYWKTSERFLTRLWIERSIVNHLNRHTSLSLSLCVCMRVNEWMYVYRIHLFIWGQNSLLPWQIGIMAASKAPCIDRELIQFKWLAFQLA